MLRHEGTCIVSFFYFFIIALSLFLFCSYSSALAAGGEDFYELLGLNKDADSREIRRAFKKLAMKYHPDKNKDDPEAHDKFVRINRAYEILKDEELRKKYDLYGEEGLKDGFQGQQHYQSWQFFENFGIYDDDQEIVTLSASDFETLVFQGDELWFVNFYSGGCGHCHQLAPAWRALAQELYNVIRIGAVNCEEDWMLCRQQGIFSYPSLIIYPHRVKYEGARERESMVEFAMEQVKATVLKVHEKNVEALSGSWEPYRSRPWLLDLCDESESCLSALTRKKLATMLEGLVNVGSIDCVQSESLCDRLARHSGVVFYPASEISKEHETYLESFDAQELASVVLKFLPDAAELTDEKLQNLIVEIESEQSLPYLVHFVSRDGNLDLELRKFPALTDDVKMAQFNCSKFSATCASLHLQKLPAFAVFKASGGYEIYHGRQSVHDLARFATDAAKSNVRVLGPDDFPQRVQADPAPWFVDFFAPWCPPCMKLLPELRKASKTLKSEVRFGTVDCTQHQQLCVSVNVHTYPTTILYNQSLPHVFVGLHSAAQLLDFIQDVRYPSVVALNPGLFRDEVELRSPEVLWVVDFFAPWCGPCQQLEPEWNQLAKLLKEKKNIRVGKVDCEQNSAFCRQQAVQSYPTIRAYPLNRGSPIEYRSWYRDVGSLRQWVHGLLPSKVQTLNSESFVHDVLNGEGPWLVDFFAPWCGHCQIFAPEFELAAEMLEGRVRAGKLNCDQHPRACQMAGLGAYPTVRLFLGRGAEEQTQDAEGLDIGSQDHSEIVAIVLHQLGDSEDYLSGRHDEL